MTQLSASDQTAGRDQVARLVEQAQAGDLGAFEALYRAHVSRVYGLCLRMLGDPSWADELTQEVFVKAWQKLASFKGRSAFATWLFPARVQHRDQPPAGSRALERAFHRARRCNSRARARSSTNPTR